MNKYNNKKCTYNNLKFDSNLEKNYYIYLQNNKESLGICNIKLQVPFLLISTIRYNGVTYSKVSYKADFVITYKSGLVEVVDVKGLETPVFRIKRRLLLERHKDINFYCVKKEKGQWIKY